MGGVRIVLVRPESPANVGAVARALRNAGLAGLDLVAPGDWRTVECWRTAWGAQDVLEQARVFATLEEAVGGAHYVVGLSGRRPSGVPALDVREMAAEVAALGTDQTAAMVFGPETTGLSEAELIRCGRRSFIPSHPDQPSLNLSHAVMVAAYEVYRAGRRPPSLPRRATAAEKDELLALLRRGLVALEALPAGQAESHFRDWTALVQRADFTRHEVRLLEHLARKMARAASSEAAADASDPVAARTRR